MGIVDIRLASVDDAHALAAVYHNAYRENRKLGFPAKAESVDPETVEEWITADKVFVAVVDDEVIGGIRLSKTAPGRVKLSRLAVREDWKGEGIGSRLVDRVESTVRTRGATTIWLTTPEGHPYLPDFYRSRGYEKTGNYPLEYREYDEIVLEKLVE